MTDTYVKVPASGGASNVTIGSEALTIGAVTTAPTKGTTTLDLVCYYVSNGVLHANYEYHQTVAGSAGSGVYLFSLPNSYEVHSSWFVGEANYRRTIGMGMVSNHSLAQGSSTAVARASLMNSTQFSLTYWSSTLGITPIQSSAFHLNGLVTYTIQISVPIAT